VNNNQPSGTELIQTGEGSESEKKGARRCGRRREIIILSQSKI